MEDKKPYEVATTADNSPAAMMVRALSTPGMDLDKLKQFMELQERWEKNEARKAYTEAMAAFKKNPPEIEKDKHVKYGNTEYFHASLGNVTTKINTALGEHGLSAAWTTEQGEKGVSVTCKITHILGHFETTTLTAANDTSGAKNAIQALGSTISYLERYTILALTGLATHEMDNDGGGKTEYISETQLSTIVDFINEKGVDVVKFKKFMGVDDYELIPAANFNRAIEALKLAKGKAAA